MRKMISSSDTSHKGQRLLPNIRDKTKTERKPVPPLEHKKQERSTCWGRVTLGLKPEGRGLRNVSRNVEIQAWLMASE